MNIAELMDKGYVERCPVCGGLSAYAWDDVSPELTDHDIYYRRPNPNEKHLVAHIPSSSAFEWQCGHCGASLTSVDSPLNAEVYTHLEAQHGWPNEQTKWRHGFSGKRTR